MGVIHKLKREVVDFIVQKKKENPRLSCRKMVTIVENHFAIQLSKSSINNLLKDAHLNDFVEKESAPFGESSTQEIGEKEGLSLQKASDSSIIVGKKSATFSQHVQYPEVQKAFSSSLLAPNLSAAIDSMPKVFYHNMGLIFLKAAEWELAGTSVVEKILKEYVEPKYFQEFRVLSDVLPYLGFLGLQPEDDMKAYIHQGLGLVGRVSQDLDSHRLWSIFRNLNQTNGLYANAVIELLQLFTMIGFCRLELESGHNIIIDSALTSVWYEGVLSPFYAPMGHVLHALSTRFFHNDEPLVLACSSATPKALESLEKGSVKEDFYYFILACENIPGQRFENIQIVNHNNQMTYNFNRFSVKKRLFIAGIWPWQKMYSQLLSLGLSTNYKSLDVENPNTQLIYQEYVTNINQIYDTSYTVSLRAIILSESADQSPMGILITNAQPDQMSVEMVIKHYIMRWPYLVNGENMRFVQGFYYGNQEFLLTTAAQRYNMFIDIYLRKMLTKNGTLLDLIRKIFQLLQMYCQIRFFNSDSLCKDESDIYTKIYGLKGYVSSSKTMLKVGLKLLDEKDAFLKSAKTRVNEGEIFNPCGRQIFLD
jgi:hypothetical protein